MKLTIDKCWIPNQNLKWNCFCDKTFVPCRKCTNSSRVVWLGPKEVPKTESLRERNQKGKETFRIYNQQVKQSQEKRSQAGKEKEKNKERKKVGEWSDASGRKKHAPFSLKHLNQLSHVFTNNSFDFFVSLSLPLSFPFFIPSLFLVWKTLSIC